MNNKLLFTCVIAALCMRIDAGNIEISPSKELKISIDGQNIIEKDHLDFCDFKNAGIEVENNQIIVRNNISGSGAKYEKVVFSNNHETRISLKGSIPPDTAEMVSYKFYIPRKPLENAKCHAKSRHITSKKLDLSQYIIREIPAGMAIKDCTYLFFDNNHKSFAIDFDIKGTLSWGTEYEEGFACAEVEFQNHYIVISINRTRISGGGIFDFKVIFRGGEVEYSKIHGLFDKINYKSLNPIVKYVRFSEKIRQPEKINGTVEVDLDYAMKKKIYDKGTIITCGKKDDGSDAKWLNPEVLDFGSGGTGGSLYDDFVFSRHEAVFEYPLKNGLYLTTLYIKDIENKDGFSFKADVNGTVKTVNIGNNSGNEILMPFEVRDGKCAMKFSPVKEKWLLNGFSTIFLLGADEDFIFSSFLPGKKIKTFKEIRGELYE